MGGGIKAWELRKAEELGVGGGEEAGDGDETVFSNLPCPCPNTDYLKLASQYWRLEDQRVSRGKDTYDCMTAGRCFQ